MKFKKRLQIMKFENGIFEENYKISFSQMGIHDVLTNRSFLSLMENLAGQHSAYCHFSFSDIAKDNLSWVILNWKLQVFRRPKDEEEVVVETWGRFFNKIFVLRDFKVIDDDGNLCAIATSKWCLINNEKGKIAHMPDNLDEIYHGLNSTSVFNIDDLPKLNVPKDVEPSFSDKYKIRRFDLDFNHHVHNLNYLNFAYELLPMDVYTGNELNNVEIAYKREIKYGETIHSFLYTQDNQYTIVIKDEDEKIVHSIIKLY